MTYKMELLSHKEMQFFALNSYLLGYVPMDLNFFIPQCPSTLQSLVWCRKMLA